MRINLIIRCCTDRLYSFSTAFFASKASKKDRLYNFKN